MECKIPKLYFIFFKKSKKKIDVLKEGKFFLTEKTFKKTDESSWSIEYEEFLCSLCQRRFETQGIDIIFHL